MFLNDDNLVSMIVCMMMFHVAKCRTWLVAQGFMKPSNSSSYNWVPLKSKFLNVSNMNVNEKWITSHVWSYWKLLTYVKSIKSPTWLLESYDIPIIKNPTFWWLGCGPPAATGSFWLRPSKGRWKLAILRCDGAINGDFTGKFDNWYSWDLIIDIIVIIIR